VAVSVDELIVPITKDQALAFLFDLLRGHGFPVESWQSGSLQRTMFEAFAELASEKLLVADQLARAGLLSLSSGGWLDLLSDSHYDNQRFEAVKTLGVVSLTDSDGTGPHTIGVDEVVVSDADGRRYRNTTGGTLALSGVLPLYFEAEVGGNDGNVPINTLTVRVEGPPGVTVNNPDLGPGTWITRSGADQETDASLQQRDRTKWAGLGVNGPAEAYENWAREADPAVTRVFVDAQNPRGPGTLDVYLAGASGAVAGPVVAAVQNYIDGTTDLVRRRALCADVLALSATNLPVNFTGTVYCDPAMDAVVLGDVVLATLNAFLRAVPIGGVKSFDGDAGELLIGQLYYALFSIPGVVNVVLTAPAANIAMLKTQVAVMGTPDMPVLPAAL
jgi:uncharacterized phage protein gp47/JayE